MANDILCPECGANARAETTLDGRELIICTDPLCDNADSSKLSVQVARLMARINEEDFAVGDEFRVGRFSFMVVADHRKNIYWAV